MRSSSACNCAGVILGTPPAGQCIRFAHCVFGFTANQRLAARACCKGRAVAKRQQPACAAVTRNTPPRRRAGRRLRPSRLSSVPAARTAAVNKSAAREDGQRGPHRQQPSDASGSCIRSSLGFVIDKVLPGALWAAHSTASSTTGARPGLHRPAQGMHRPLGHEIALADDLAVVIDAVGGTDGATGIAAQIDGLAVAPQHSRVVERPVSAER